MTTLTLLSWFYIHLNFTLLYTPSPTMGFNGITSISQHQSYNQSLNEFLKYGFDTPSTDKSTGFEISFKWYFN